MHPIIQKVAESLTQNFKETRRILSFTEYLDLVAEEPLLHMRNASQYCQDMIDHFGTRQTQDHLGTRQEFRVLDQDFLPDGRPVVGLHDVMEEFYRSLSNFTKEKSTRRLLLLHGPNGSAKTSLLLAISRGLEHYSQTSEGAAYKFNWVFPSERSTKSSLGLRPDQQVTASDKNLDSYAHLPDKEMAARLPDELRDHPLFLFPPEQRRRVITELLKAKKQEHLIDKVSDYLLYGHLSAKNKAIFDGMLASYGGDYKKVYAHIQVERFFISRRYLTGGVSIEPQMHVDAHARQITMDQSLGHLPTSLHNISLFELQGDLVNGNRGIVEFNDLLKRPIESFKYLLAALESSYINVGAAIAFLDVLWLGTSNETQFDAFKEFPDFGSFRVRMEPIRVPYLLRVSEEQRIYDWHLSTITMEKKLAPHTTKFLALWSVLTRLRPPSGQDCSDRIRSIVKNLNPLQKARLIDLGSLPENLTQEEQRELKSYLPKLYDEYKKDPFYEGRLGASPREMKTLLLNASHNERYKTLSPSAIFDELEKFVTRISEFEFLRMEPKDHYFNPTAFIKLVREDYLDLLDQEFREAFGIIDNFKVENYLSRYFTQVKHYIKKEKIKNPMTGAQEDPSEMVMTEVETILGITKDIASHRSQVISSVGAWGLASPGQKIIYSQIFPEFFRIIKNHFEQETHGRFAHLLKGFQGLCEETDLTDFRADLEVLKKAQQTLVEKLRYPKEYLLEAVALVLKRYI